MTASPSLSIERITAASIENVEPIAETLALAFDDHIMRALCGTDAELRLARMRATAVTTIKDLECYVAHLPGSKRADCVMLVKPPGLEHGVSPNSSGPHTDAVKELLAERPEFTEATTQIKKIFHDIQVEAYGPTSVRDKYYISHLATAPWAAGHGVGGQMLQWIVDKGRKEGKDVALLTMTERHAKYYERFGFKTKATMAADLNGVPTEWWAMNIDD